MTIITTVDFLRHGDVQGKACYRGVTDDPLTTLGWQQMQLAIQGYNPWSAIVSSPLKRCVEFATELGLKHKIRVQPEARLQEVNFGIWEGKTALEINQLDPNGLDKFYLDPNSYTPPQAEKFIDFQARIKHVWQDLLRTYQGQHILCITHAGVIRAVFTQLLKIPVTQSFAIQVQHASLSQFQCLHTDTENFVQFNFHK